eukprot:jgi/Tetstr1/446233/TSEL_033777.t1
MLPAHVPARNTGEPLSHKVGGHTFGWDAEAASVARTPPQRSDAESPLARGGTELFEESGDFSPDDLSAMTVRQLEEMARVEGIPIPRSDRKKNKAGLVEYLSRNIPRRD